MDQNGQAHNRSDFIATTAFVVFLIVFFSLLYAFVIIPNQTTNDTPVTPTPSSNVAQAVTVPFDYLVMDISNSMIVLSGNTGNMHLPNDPTVVQLVNTQSESLALNVLEVGNKVRLKMVPGEAAWLTLVE